MTDAATADDGERASPAEPEGRPLAQALRAGAIRVHGARQNNLRNLSLDIPTNELVVVTGVSGSGKSSLVFDTIYAEGQRRYVETFSAYARQFLDRMDKPQVDRIEGVPPAIAIDQTNPVRTSRSTVGTMTELNDHLKLLFARLASLSCRECGAPVERDDPASIVDQVMARSAAMDSPRLIVTFPVTVPEGFSDDEVREHLAAQGYDRIHVETMRPDGGRVFEIVQDRLRARANEAERLAEAVDIALARGHGRLAVHVADTTETWRFSRDLHCPRCDLDYDDPLPSLFSFNSPLGACETCRGFGRVIGVDHGLVIPDESLSLREGAVKPWQSKSFSECQRDLLRYGRAAGIDLDSPWADLTEEARRWVIEGDPAWTGRWRSQWYGVDHFFQWLESKAYKMHIRVLLSRYRAYRPCTACGGARLKPEALLWRIGDATSVAATGHTGASGNGFTLHELMLMPIRRLARFFEALTPHTTQDTQAAREALEMLLTEIRARLRFLTEVGLDYLTLDRQSRTLSGGEVQRINLTTALGTSLVNTLFVLDEPSIGLHPRDMARIIRVMTRLRDAGNSLLVVEHDPLVMQAADRIIDIGPGPGEHGGQIVYQGAPQAMHEADTLTAAYLTGRRQIATGHARVVKPNTPRLLLEGVRANNLKNVDLSLPLGRMVCVTGVSGSGKSTLIQDVLLPALLKRKGRPTDAPGEHDRLLGDDWIDDVAFVDQSPIGKTARSNPASYVGAFDAIRRRFASLPAARERGFTAGTFSFNGGNGRCPTCRGNGFEHVEMQFLSDVYLRCPDCDGTRYRPETLEVRLAPATGAMRADGVAHVPRTIAQVLDLTVSEALTFFRGDTEICDKLRPLSEVGLDYLRLGQPVPTLSGGEAQRLKLAGFLAQAAPGGARRPGKARCGTLFMFDEPTTGLHFDDVARLLRALRRLVDAGHSLVVIEHNLDVVASADWIIDLGPEGGEDGGRIVATGTPQALREHPTSHTGASLRDALDPGALLAPQTAATLLAGEPDPGDYQHAMRERARQAITVHHAREHNLKDIDVEIPRDALSVITGVSGSGKSTLAFDVVFGEGQRRYLESLNAYARQFVQPSSRPDVDGVFGIPPTVSIEQRTSRGGRKSTVATLTEIYHFLRLLYVKLGVQHCPDCDTVIEPQDFESIVARIGREYRGQHIGLLAPLIVARKGLYTDLAKWARGHGYTHLRVDCEFLPTQGFPRLDRYVEHDIELPIADLVVEPANEQLLREALTQALEHGKGVVMVATGLEALREAIDGGDARGSGAPLSTRLMSSKRACPSCGTSFPELDPRLFSFNSRLGWCRHCLGTGVTLPGTPKAPHARHGDEDTSAEAVGMLAERLADQLDEPRRDDDTGTEIRVCGHCDGQRLNPTALAVRLDGRSISEATAAPIDDARQWMSSMALDTRARTIAQDSLGEIDHRLRFLSEVGLGYLALDRAAPTLSGGEAQRIRLAGQLGSNLQGVCYVLDEPSIGLHPRDNRMLLDTLLTLRDKGNTLIVVEHDEETMREADHLIDIGPRAGRLGGHVVATGSIADLSAQADSVTGRYLAAPLAHPLNPQRHLPAPSEWLSLEGIERHNLSDIAIRLPLQRLTVITGVSGSGKSTLAREVLLPNARARSIARRLRKPVPKPDGLRRIGGDDGITRVLEVDQTPIGKTPRSCPATYIGFWDAIRRMFADSPEARLRGYGPARFSFNTGAGRCPACEGQGQQTIEMNFLPDVKVHCDACDGQRFNRDTLEIRVRERSIGDVLRMSVDEALAWFENHESIRRPLALLSDVGLGYLTLGQPSPTLSGGEAQRIKLVAELARVRPNRGDGARRGQASGQEHALYVLDEPTVGLHMADVEKLIHVLHRLVDTGNTVVVVEHDVDIWAEADWIIDLGPGGGRDGGQVVAAGPPTEIIASNTATGRSLSRAVARA